MNKMKKFFTLDRHHAEGFTLVELIVVIAILAILGGVAVPAYSGYIEKTNKTADQTLVGEVAGALSLYYYDNLDTQVAYVILAPEGADLSGIEVTDEAGAAAMKAVFGEGWQDTAVLKTSGWDTNGVVNAALEQGGFAAAVGMSSYLNGSTTQELLGDVTEMTTAAAGVMAGMTPTMVYDTICGNLFGEGATAEAEMEKMCAQFGVKTEDGTIAAGQETQLSNFLVFAAAQQIGGNQPANDFTNAVNNYASCVAYANANPDDPAIQEAYANLNAELAKGNVSQISTFMGDPGYAAYAKEDQATYDKLAFNNIMQAVSKASGSITAEDVKNSELFNSEKIANYFDTYVAAANAMGALTPEQREIMSAAVEKAKNVGGVAVLLFSGPAVGCTSMEALLQ